MNLCNKMCAYAAKYKTQHKCSIDIRKMLILDPNNILILYNVNSSFCTKVTVYIYLCMYTDRVDIQL